MAIENVGGRQMFSLQAGERVSFFCRISRITRSGLRILQMILWLRRELFGTKYLPKEFFCAKVEKSEPPGFHYKKVSHHSEGGSDQIHLIFFQSLLAISKADCAKIEKIRAYFAQVICVINIEGFSPVRVLSLRYKLRLARLGLRWYATISLLIGT
jgi:hypothetical protein